MSRAGRLMDPYHQTPTLVDGLKIPMKKRFEFEDDLPLGPRVVLRGWWDQSVKEFMIERGIRTLVLGALFPDLLFLKEAPIVETLIIVDTVKDTQGIENLRGLRRLLLRTPRNVTVDFTLFPHLADCELEWSRGCDSIFECRSLKRLFLYASKEKSTERFGRLENLEELEISVAPIRDLRGLGGLRKLNHLELHYLTKLESLDGLETLTQLEELKIGACKKIGRLDPLKPLINLKRLDVDNCGDLESLAPVRRLKKLEVLSFVESSRIMDGDLDCALALPNLRRIHFANRKFYTHRWYYNDETECLMAQGVRPASTAGPLERRLFMREDRIEPPIKR